MMSRVKVSQAAVHRGVIATIVAAWLALILSTSLIVLMGLRAPMHIDVEASVNSYLRAAAFSENFLLVCLGGSPDDADKLASMSTMQTKPTLNSNPYTVLSVNVLAPIRKTKAGADTEWGVTVAATIIQPGTDTRTRSYYRLLLLESDDTFKALEWPRPINDTSRAVEVTPYYTVGVAQNTPLGATVRDFMTAYYVATADPQPTRTHRINPLDGLVTAAFTDHALTNSVFSKIDVQQIMQAKSSPDTATAKPGTTVHVQVSAKASSSTTTFVSISAPLRLTLADNKQWLVDGFDEPIHFGDVSFK